MASSFGGRLPLWGAQWDTARLKAKRRQIGERAFEQGYRMRAYTDEDRTFLHFDAVLTLGADKHVPDPMPTDWTCFVGVDLSSAQRPGNVLFCLAVDAQGVRRPLEIVRVKGSSPEVAAALSRVYYRHRPELIMVEDNAYQGALIEWVQAMGDDYPWWSIIVPWTTTANKHRLSIGLPALDAEFSNGAWQLCGTLRAGHDVDCECGLCVWVREMRHHPLYESNDCVMACWFARNAVRLWEGDQQIRAQLPELQHPRVFGRVEW